MSTDRFKGLLWGICGEREEPAFAPRLSDDHRTLHLSGDAESGWDIPDDVEGDWHLWEGYDDRALEHGAQTYEGDPSFCWVGVPVAMTTAPLRHYLEERDDFCAGLCVENAREGWEKFRAHCIKTVDFDPGAGELLVVRDGF